MPRKPSFLGGGKKKENAGPSTVTGPLYASVAAWTQQDTAIILRNLNSALIQYGLKLTLTMEEKLKGFIAEKRSEETKRTATDRAYATPGVRILLAELISKVRSGEFGEAQSTSEAESKPTVTEEYNPFTETKTPGYSPFEGNLWSNDPKSLEEIDNFGHGFLLEPFRLYRYEADEHGAAQTGIEFKDDFWIFTEDGPAKGKGHAYNLQEESDKVLKWFDGRVEHTLTQIDDADRHIWQDECSLKGGAVVRSFFAHDYETGTSSTYQMIEFTSHPGAHYPINSFDESKITFAYQASANGEEKEISISRNSDGSWGQPEWPRRPSLS